MVGPRVLFLFCPEFKDVPPSVAGLDDLKSLGLLHNGLLDATGGELCEDGAIGRS